MNIFLITEKFNFNSKFSLVNLVPRVLSPLPALPPTLAAKRPWYRLVTCHREVFGTLGGDEDRNYLLRCITNTSRRNLSINKSPHLYCNQSFTNVHGNVI